MILFKFIRNIKRFFYSNLLKKIAKKSGKIYVNRYSRINRNTVLGDNVNFNGLIVYGDGELTIGNNFHSGRNISIFTRIHNYKGNKLPYDELYIRKKVIIEDNVWIGSNVIIIGNVKIGEGSIVQAGSVVVKDLPKLSIAGGNPAVPFKKRDANHYNDLKTKKLFH